MYKYPNGLTCNVSKKRIQSYERIVPPLALMLIFAGFAMAAILIFDRVKVLESVTLIMTSGTIWTLFCVLVSFKVFELWCKPVD